MKGEFGLVYIFSLGGQDDCVRLDTVGREFESRRPDHQTLNQFIDLCGSRALRDGAADVLACGFAISMAAYLHTAAPFAVAWRTAISICGSPKLFNDGRWFE